MKLRRYTSVSEQGAELIRLVDPEYHCETVRLDFNTFSVDLARVEAYDSQRTVLIAPGASSKGKDWGVENYLQLAADLKNYGWEPLFLLGPQETELYRDAAENAGFKTAVKMSLTDIAALALNGQFNGLAVGNDTGVMHIIRACGCRSVTICYADNHFVLAPYGKTRHAVVHASCADYESCLKCQKMDCGREFTCNRIFNVIQERSQE